MVRLKPNKVTILFIKWGKRVPDDWIKASYLIFSKIFSIDFLVHEINFCMKLLRIVVCNKHTFKEFREYSIIT